MNTRISINAICLFLMLIGITRNDSCLAQSPNQADQAGKTEKADKADSLKNWLSDLSSKTFFDREQATLNLIDEGTSVIDPLVASIPMQNYEGTSRVMFILRQLALKATGENIEIAREALEQLAESESRRISRRASTVLDELNEIRQGEAVKQIVALGGSVNRESIPVGQQFMTFLTVRIGEEWTGGVDDLKHLKWIGQAEAIHVEGEQVTDDWLFHVGKMRNLKSLIIKRGKVSDVGIDHLSNLQKLINVEFFYVEIGNPSVDTILKWKQTLQYLKIYGSTMTEEMPDRIKAGIPGIDLDFRLGAFLGVACPRPPDPCFVSSIQPNSGALKAGILSGDLIIGMDDEEINTFDDLRKVISRYASGDKTAVDFIRPIETRLKQFLRTEDVEFNIEVEDHPNRLGAVVKSVPEDSAWHKAGLKPGDVIRELDNAEVFSAKAFKGIFDNTAVGQVMRLSVITKHEKRRVEVTFGEWD